MSITAATGIPVIEPANMPVLELKGIGKQFGAIRALHDVDFAIRPGEVVGLMGDNGAGKSTLVRIIAGNFPPSQGTIHFDGREVHFRRPVDSRAVGIEAVYRVCAFLPAIGLLAAFLPDLKRPSLEGARLSTNDYRLTTGRCYSLIPASDATFLTNDRFASMRE